MPRRRTAGALLCVATAVALVLFASRLAGASADPTSDEAQFTAMTNASRALAGESTVGPVADLTSMAQAHAQDMAAEDRLFHSAEPAGTSVGQQLGEIVGRDSVDDPDRVAAVHRAFLASPRHRETMLTAMYTEIGVGVAYSGSTMYVTEVFRLPLTATSPPTTPPTTVVPVGRPRPAVVRRPSSAPAKPELQILELHEEMLPDPLTPNAGTG
jgi:uncharacterized protein YkwD